MNELKEAIAKYGNIRPLHKARIAAEAVSAALNFAHPEPMSYLHKRERELPLRPLPRPTEFGIGKVFQAATAQAEWDNSDPFAFKRTVLHIRQGFVSPEDIIKEATRRTNARRVAKAKEVDDAKNKPDAATAG